MDAEPFTLVCFAVKEEAGPFRAQATSLSRIETLITGMGARNAEKAIRDAIAGRRPTLVLTCGFAGGLRPGLEKGEVIVSADPNPQLPNARSSAKALRNSPSPRPSPQGEGDLATAALAPLSLESALLAAGARAGKFHCAAKVATTKAEKRALWESTGADAVDMESQVIREICEKEQIPSATVRVILDTAEQDLPLDFNQLMNERQEMDYTKLAMALAKSPGKIRALMRFQNETKSAAEKLTRVLVAVLEKSGLKYG